MLKTYLQFCIFCVAVSDATNIKEGKYNSHCPATTRLHENYEGPSTLCESCSITIEHTRMVRYTEPVHKKMFPLQTFGNRKIHSTKNGKCDVCIILRIIQF